MTDLHITGLTKSYGPVTALDGVDLTVPAGSILAVLGPSGCGKTTLLRCVAGAERPDTGRILVGDRLLAGPAVHVAPHRRGITIVPQEGALFPHLSVRDNIGYGLDRAARRSSRVDEMLDLIGLAGHGGRMPHQLSGGQQQRVAVARALAPDPHLVLLDEPFSALDAALRTDLRRDIRALLLATGATAILVTHDQGEALSTADHVAVMRDGRIRQIDTPQRLYHEPADPWTATFLGEAVLLPASVEAGRAHTALGHVPVSSAYPAGSQATIMLRPEQLRVHGGSHDGVRVVVVDRQFHGHDALVTLELADGTVVTARTPGSVGVSLGEHATVTVDGTACAWPLSDRSRR